MQDQPIILGPSYQLHVGVHGALLDNPPCGYGYLQLPAQVHFRFAQQVANPSPFSVLSVSERISFPTLADAYAPVHLSRSVYAGHGPWIVDADCLLATLQFGHFFPIGSLAAIHAGNYPVDILQRRQRTMIRALASPRCIAILMRTEHARKRLLAQVARVADKWLDVLDAKTFVVRPALPCSAATCRPDRRLSVLYCGRTFDDKGGDIAADVFVELRGRYQADVDLTWVGDCPRSILSRLRAAGVQHLPITSRAQFLQILSSTDIYCSPTRFESFGMALVEAAAAGVVVVTSSGDGMAHIAELFESDRNAVLIPDHPSAQDTRQAYLQAITSLIDNPQRLARMRAAILASSRHGRLSIAARDRVLLPVYARLHAAAADMRRRRPAAMPMPVRDTWVWPEAACYWEIARLTGNKATRVRV